MSSLPSRLAGRDPSARCQCGIRIADLFGRAVLPRRPDIWAAEHRSPTRIMSGLIPHCGTATNGSKSNLFLEAGARRLAGVLVNGPVVHADRGLGEIAPEMAGRGLPVFLVREGLLRRRAGEFFFRPRIFEKNGVHGFTLSA